MGFEVSESGGQEVSESEGQGVSESVGLEVSESDAKVSESGGEGVSESEGLGVSESDAEVSESDVGPIRCVLLVYVGWHSLEAHMPTLEDGVRSWPTWLSAKSPRNRPQELMRMLETLDSRC